LNLGTAPGVFIVDISPAQHGIQKQPKRFPLSIKSGTKNTYTLKLNGTAFEPARFTHIMTQSNTVNSESGDPNGEPLYDPDVWDPGKGFSVSKMKATNRWFPTTGFYGAGFEIKTNLEGRVFDKYYRCRVTHGDWVRIDRGTRCNVEYLPHLKPPTTHATIALEHKVNDNWIIEDTYTINIPKLWAFGVGNSYLYSKKNGKSYEYEALDICKKLITGSDKKTTYEEMLDKKYREKYMYHQYEITNVSYDTYAKEYFYRTIDGTLMGEWGSLHHYYLSPWWIGMTWSKSDLALRKTFTIDHPIAWEGVNSSYLVARIVDLDGNLGFSYENEKYITLCRGESFRD